MISRVWFLSVLLLVLVSCASPQRPDGGQGLLGVGAPAPRVEGMDHRGTTYRLSEQRGKPVVVYFYPKDQTPGCTKQACAFRDVWGRYQAAGVQVFGVSSDTKESHERFAAKHDLEFPLIADTEGTWGKAFGVGKTMGLYQRVTFLVGPDGKIAKVYPNVDPGLNAKEVLADAAQL